MRSVPILAALASLAQLATAAYRLLDDYGSGDAFFDKFTFFTDDDPTKGYVDYVSREVASQAGYIGVQNGATFIGMDNTNVASGRGRQSVRIESKANYKNALIVLDLAHMPASVCGSWPAFWTLGISNWPYEGEYVGEVDIIEGVNEQKKNTMAVHTSNGCTIDGQGFSGSLLASNCYIYAPNQDSNGCAIEAADPNSYGTNFNGNGGGIYATEISNQGVNIWFFPRGTEPADIRSENPNPSSWGMPTGRFGGSGCDWEKRLNPQFIIFDLTFCGSWAGAVWQSEGCASRASTCEDFVRDNPGEFKESYWLINSLRVYEPF